VAQVLLASLFAGVVQTFLLAAGVVAASLPLVVLQASMTYRPQRVGPPVAIDWLNRPLDFQSAHLGQNPPNFD
jgi:hypothetical protein